MLAHWVEGAVLPQGGGGQCPLPEASLQLLPPPFTSWWGCNPSIRTSNLFKMQLSRHLVHEKPKGGVQTENNILFEASGAGYFCGVI